MPMILLLAAAASAGGADAADARCISLMNYLGTHGTGQQVEAAKVGTMFFLGKLRGRNPSVAIGPLVRSASEAATKAKVNPQTEIARCGAEVTAAGAALAPPKK